MPATSSRWRVYTANYNRERPHRGLALLAPETGDPAGLPALARSTAATDSADSSTSTTEPRREPNRDFETLHVPEVADEVVGLLVADVLDHVAGAGAATKSARLPNLRRLLRIFGDAEAPGGGGLAARADVELAAASPTFAPPVSVRVASHQKWVRACRVSPGRRLGRRDARACFDASRSRSAWCSRPSILYISSTILSCFRELLPLAL